MIKAAAIRILSAPPVWTALRRRALAGDPLTILCYHTLSADRGGIDSWSALRISDFRAQLKDLAQHYTIVSLEDALSLKSNTDKPRAVLTFDDGDRGLATHLLPLLRETPVAVTIYVATQQIETGRAFWFDRVINAHQQAGEIRIDGLGHWQIPKKTGKARWAVLGQVLQALKGTGPEQREDLTDEIAAQGMPPVGMPLGPMTPEELGALANTAGVTIGAHSHGHELLDQISPEAARESIALSRARLKDWTGQEVRHFAYPNGNHSAAVRAITKEAGFATATALEERTVAKTDDLFALPRISVGRYDSLARVRLRLVGL